jgi:predicted RNA-binding protein YlqC (UPF0109 family)
MAGDKGPDLRSWVEAMAKDLVDHPETVEVRLVEEDDGDVFELSVEPDEMGRVIGRQGRTAQALRTLMRVAGARHGRDYELEILD